jgi:hypothetical protein
MRFRTISVVLVIALAVVACGVWSRGRKGYAPVSFVCEGDDCCDQPASTLSGSLADGRCYANYGGNTYLPYDVTSRKCLCRHGPCSCNTAD